MILTLAFLIYVVLVWTQISPDEAVMEINLRSLALWSVVAAYPIYYLASILVTIPNREIDNFTRINALKKRLTPRLCVSVLNDGKPFETPSGTTIIAVGGARISNASGLDRIIGLCVSNPSDRISDLCGANLIEFVGDNGKRITDPISLKWRGIGEPDQEYTCIPAKSTKTIRMFTVFGDAIYFVLDDLPIEYTHIFNNGTRFTGKIAISDRYYSSQVIHFAFETNPPLLNIIQVEGSEPPMPLDIESETPP
jgi:hypothetical protein